MPYTKPRGRTYAYFVNIWYNTDFIKEHSKAIISAVTWSLSLLTVLTILTREFRYHASYKLYATVEYIEIRWILIEGVLWQYSTSIHPDQLRFQRQNAVRLRGIILKARFTAAAQPKRWAGNQFHSFKFWRNLSWWRSLLAFSQMQGRGNSGNARKKTSFYMRASLREASHLQNGWIFGKVPNGLWSPPPHFRKVILQIF